MENYCIYRIQINNSYKKYVIINIAPNLRINKKKLALVLKLVF